MGDQRYGYPDDLPRLIQIFRNRSHRVSHMTSRCASDASTARIVVSGPFGSRRDASGAILRCTFCRLT